MSPLIRMNIADDDAFLSPYWADRPLVSEDVSDFLDNAISAIHSKDLPDLEIVLISRNITPQEFQMYQDAIHNSYSQKLVSLMRQNRRNFQSAVVMLAIGILLLIFNVSRTMAGNRPVLAEVFDTIATVFIWTSVDTFWFQRYDVHQEEKRVYALSQATIRLETLPEENGPSA